MGREERLSVSLAGGGGCDVFTISPVLAEGGVAVAPIGLTCLLNAGGAVLACRPGEYKCSGDGPAGCGAAAWSYVQ